MRPKARSPEIEEVAKKAAEAEQAKRRAAAVQKAASSKNAAPKRGNAQQNARAGATTGTRTATSKSSGSGGAKANASGNAAVNNYPGLVMSCVSRSGRPNVRGRGTARVSFSVDSNGRLANVALAAASGSAALDRAAVDLVRRVRSCPPPPPGARRSFSIGISAR
jgi:protein TonB